MDIKVKDFIRISKAELICGDIEEVCENFCKDSREVKKRRYIFRNKRRKY